MAKKSAKKTTLTLPALKKGEIWRGILADAEGKPLHHVIELGLKAQHTPHAEAAEIAKKAGGHLATCREGRLIAASDDRKRTGSFWLADLPDEPDYAYYQDFSNGGQYWDRKSLERRVVAVRRVPI